MLPALRSPQRPPSRLTAWLVALLLWLAQAGFLAHAVEHAKNDGVTAQHTCALCLAADHLTTPPPATPPAIAPLAASLPVEQHALRPTPTQRWLAPAPRGPPLA